jgi:hypothetical protein
MTSPIRESDILKQDARGRVLVSAARREALLDEFERSGSSAMRFARLAGLKYSTFANWIQARRRRRALVQPPGCEATAGNGLAESGGPVRLFEALVEGGSGGCEQARRAEGGVVIELPGGCRLSVGSPAELPMVAELVALIAQAVRARC